MHCIFNSTYSSHTFCILQDMQCHFMPWCALIWVYSLTCTQALKSEVLAQADAIEGLLQRLERESSEGRGPLQDFEGWKPQEGLPGKGVKAGLWSCERPQFFSVSTSFCWGYYLNWEGARKQESQLNPSIYCLLSSWQHLTFWFGNTWIRSQMVPRDLNIGFQGLALIQGQIYNPVEV